MLTAIVIIAVGFVVFFVIGYHLTCYVTKKLDALSLMLISKH
ncbi:hypothetical protein [Vibrio sp. FJH11]